MCVNSQAYGFKINPYNPCVANKMVLYVRLQKEIYGCLKSALLFYEKLVGDLEAYGFRINPYDPCVADKMKDGKQLTVYWHVEDLKNNA